MRDKCNMSAGGQGGSNTRRALPPVRIAAPRMRGQSTNPGNVRQCVTKFEVRGITSLTAFMSNVTRSCSELRRTGFGDGYSATSILRMSHSRFFARLTAATHMAVGSLAGSWPVTRRPPTPPNSEAKAMRHVGSSRAQTNWPSAIPEIPLVRPPSDRGRGCRIESTLP